MYPPPFIGQSRNLVIFSFSPDSVCCRTTSACRPRRLHRAWHCTGNDDCTTPGTALQLLLGTLALWPPNRDTGPEACTALRILMPLSLMTLPSPFSLALLIVSMTGGGAYKSPPCLARKATEPFNGAIRGQLVEELFGGRDPFAYANLQFCSFFFQN